MRGKMMKQSNYRAGRIVILVLAAILFMAVNILATAWLTSSRIDLTAENLYTLSDGTKEVLAGLDEPVTLKFYFSNKVATDYPTLKNYGQRIQDLLGEYENLADGKIRLSIIDPEPFTDSEDQAVAAGLKAVQIPAGEPLYMGLAASNSTDTERTIPFFARERENFLEYDLTKLIDELANPKRPVIGLLSTLPLEYGPGGPMAAMRGQSQPYVLYDQLSQSFEVRPLKEDFTAIDSDVDLLFIAHPGDLGDNELYAIDQFVLTGGKALVFVDPYLESAAMSAATAHAAETPQSSNLKKLFDAWGLEMADGKVVADMALAQRVAMAGPGGERVAKNYLPWLAVTKDYLDADDPVTAQLENLNLASAGALLPRDGATTSFEPLISSSSEVELIDVAKLMGQPDPDALVQGFSSDGKAVAIAARITGDTSSAFEKAPLEGLQASHKSTSDGPVNVVVVADADMLEDRFWVQSQDFFGQRILMPMADNGSLVINSADNLAGSSALISLRSRGVSNRPFDVVENIRKEAENRFLEEEHELQAKLQETEQRLAELQSAGGGDGLILDENQTAEIEAFRQDMLTTRQQLRSVQHNMRSEIENLGGWIKFINIGLVPIVIILLALIMAWRHRRRPV